MIKTFENFNTNYQEISREEYVMNITGLPEGEGVRGEIESKQVFISSKWDRFTDKEISDINTLFNDKKYKFKSELIYLINDKGYYVLNRHNNAFQTSLTKLIDEYYYLIHIQYGKYGKGDEDVYRKKFYRCDQIDGLLNCLKQL